MLTDLSITKLFGLSAVRKNGVTHLAYAADGAAQIVLLGPEHAGQSYAFHESIRDLSAEDKKHYLKDYDLDFFRDNAMIGVLIHNRLAGQAVIHMDGDGGSTLQALSVHPACQGYRISKDLIAAGVRYAMSQGAAQMSARVKIDNTGTQAIFEQNGFRRRTEADHNVDDPKQSAYIYDRILRQRRDLHASVALRQRSPALWRPV